MPQSQQGHVQKKKQFKTAQWCNGWTVYRSTGSQRYPGDDSIAMRGSSSAIRRSHSR